MAAFTEFWSKVRVLRAKSIRVGDTLESFQSVDNYGKIQPPLMKNYALAEEGSYYVLSTPTPGTGIATIAALTTLADTSPFILVRNNNSVASGLRLSLDYIKLRATAAGTGGTAISFAAKVDASATARYTSGNGLASVNISGLNVNGDDSTADGCQWNAGALVAAAAGNARLLSSGVIRSVIPVVGDVYLFTFGGIDPNLPSMAINGTSVAYLTLPCAPMIVGPQQSGAFHIWLPSQSAASSYEIEVGYWVR